MAIITKIVFKARGDYDPTETYKELDYVRYMGCTWAAKKESHGVTPPATPTDASDYWALLTMDGDYVGQMPSWDDVTDKPFVEIDVDSFDVTDNVLSVKFPATPTWDDINGKPFSTLGTSFSATNAMLDIKIDGDTIQKNSSGQLIANLSSAGFNIHNMTAESEIDASDEFVFYDISASNHRKSTWANIIGKITALFSKVYASDRSIITTTYVKDSVSEINTNDATNQLAGAKAVKEIYRDIAPKPTSAPVYDGSNKAYDKGSVCSYNGKIYYCNKDIAKGTAWNSADWVEWTDNIAIKFGIDADGNYGYYKAGADSVTPFKTDSGGGGKLLTLKRETVGSFTVRSTYKIADKYPSVDLTNVTTENFAIVQTGTVSENFSQTGQSYTNTYYGRAYLSISKPSLSYNSSTHVLTVAPGSSTAKGTTNNATSTLSSVSRTSTPTFTVYFYHV